MSIDLSSDFGTRVATRLRDERIIWLTTMAADGTPQPNPVWFLWNGETVLIFSVPNQAKLANIRRNSRVSLNFNSDTYGGQVAVITGPAAVDPAGHSETELAAFGAKYDDGIKSIGLTLETFLAQYSVPIRVTPEKLRGF
jgi:PPOX class probable F420-dependent enzyme